jgi:outer membrane receptor for ferrienterochelin and colicins
MMIALKARTRMAMMLGLSLFGSAAAAQQTSSIRGIVTSSGDRTPIAGARVALQAPDRVAITDERGTYVLREVPQGSHMLLVTAIGRKPDSSRVSVGGSDVIADFALREGSLMLSSVVVSATRTPIEAQKVAATVNVLTPEQVRQSPARESQDLLREFTSVELPRTSSLVGGTAQIVSIRGVDEGRTVVLTDGFPINDAWGEWIDWGRTPKAMLDRVEVVEGGTSSLYGNGAMGGLISFFTRPLSPGAMIASVDGGSRSAKHGYIGAGVPIYGALTANVFGDYQEKGGYRLVDSGGGPIDIESQTIQRNAFARLN